MQAATPLWLRLVGALGIAWNLLGVWSYLVHVGLAPSPPDMPQSAMPPLVTAAYAIGVFGAVIGCLGLLLGRRWAAPVLVVALIGLVIDWGWVFAYSDQASVPLGATVLVVAAALAAISTNAARRGWLR